jgi:Mg-chelatase subunit ChlD
MQGTLYQEMLPVDILDPESSIAVVFIIDCSGSMWYPGSEEPYEKSKLFAAKQGAAACLELLQDGDYVGILGMADYAETPELFPAGQPDKIKAEIDSLELGGGTIFSIALDAARQALLANTQVQRRHIIMITDGLPTAMDNELYMEHAKRNAQAGITMSVVGIDCVKYAKLEMTEFVKAAGGDEKHFYDATSTTDVGPMMKDALRIAELREIVYAPFIPTIPGANYIVGSIPPEKLPSLGGIYHNQLKEGATEILHSPYGPLYAHWNYGKGMVGSFMCDLNGTWSEDFIASEEGAEILNRIIAQLANAPD